MTCRSGGTCGCPQDAPRAASAGQGPGSARCNCRRRKTPPSRCALPARPGSAPCSRFHSRRQRSDRSLYPEQIRRLSEKYVSFAEAHGKKVGIHAHNNQQLAFANTIEALKDGVSYLDATMNGMGRGAGNCAMELILGFLKNPKYSFIPILKFLETHMVKLKEEGVVWGFDIPYMLTGMMNQHPKAAIEAMASHNTNYREFFTGLLEQDI